MSSETPPIKPSQFKGDYHEYGLYLHNWYRKRHGAPPLKLAQWMNDSGDNYCRKLVRNGGMLIHSSGLGYGENLWGGPQADAYLKHEWPKSYDDYGYKCAVREAVIAWYNEVKLYNYNSPGFSMGTGHFTAMVWKASTELGIGVSWIGGTVIVAGCYKVFPNMQGQFTANVLRYRDVSDDEDKPKPVEKPKPVAITPTPVDSGTSKPSNDDVTGDGSPDENVIKPEEISDPDVRAAFDEIADKDGKIGWYELKDLLGKNKVVGKAIVWDKLICRMLIKLTVFESGEGDSSERISFLAYENILAGVKRTVDAFVRVDKDKSGFLDPFEVKDAFSEGRELSFAEVEGLIKAVGGDNGKMSLHGFLLADILLFILSTSDLGIPDNDGQAQLEWMIKQVESVRTGQPLSDMKCLQIK